MWGVMKVLAGITFLLIGTLVQNAFCEGGYNATQSVACATLVVLGNQPLDDHTPTVDMIARVDKAVEFYKAHTNSVLIFTGAPTAGKVSEARLMSNIAMASGVASNAIRLEEWAQTTSENARLSAPIVSQLHCRRILIVSKADHLEWAMPSFREYDVFKDAEPLACTVDAAKSIAQMNEYLAKHPDNERVRTRLGALLQKRQGTD
jgi:uncharacterized SAM-binding protein YcdF (DUF218 family)